MIELKVPIAFDSCGEMVIPADAQKGASYYCPGCGNLLTLRKGKKKIAHFAHKATDACSYETVIHKLAKRLLIKSLNEFINGNKPSPVIKRTCPICKNTISQSLPNKITHAVEEKKLKSGYIADVAILTNEEIAAAIEVKVTHAVSDKKKFKIGIPFIEVNGEDIVKDPMIWKPIVDSFKSFRCPECEKAMIKFKETIKEVSKTTGISVPSIYYRTAPTECWRCHKSILVFAWPDSDRERSIPREPRPRTIQYRYSKTAKHKYWVNTCPYCKSIQGDFFLYYEPDGPFFGFECGDDSVESFSVDMCTLAIRYYHGW